MPQWLSVRLLRNHLAMNSGKWSFVAGLACGPAYRVAARTSTTPSGASGDRVTALATVGGKSDHLIAGLTRQSTAGPPCTDW